MHLMHAKVRLLAELTKTGGRWGNPMNNHSRRRFVCQCGLETLFSLLNRIEIQFIESIAGTAGMMMMNIIIITVIVIVITTTTVTHRIVKF